MKTISIGNQSFSDIREHDDFYIDKTDFIREWWETRDTITLITRPRRFGKTLNMDMLRCFFSNQYEGRSDLFEGLSVWEWEKAGELQGTYPVIFLTFASIKEDTYAKTYQKICTILMRLYLDYNYLLEGDFLAEQERKQFLSVTSDMDEVTAGMALHNLCIYLSRYYGKNVILLLDEYDTPMQEAYVNGYWDKMVKFTRSLFNATFKTNPYLERGVMIGCTYITGAKFAEQTSNGSALAETMESMFSGLNNLKVVSTTSDQYATSFGFTEEEVFAALDDFGMGEQKEQTKYWYDGLTFGSRTDIYNPWSILNYLKEGEFGTYWANTSSNSLVAFAIRQGDPERKQTMESLLRGETLKVQLDEQIIFDQLDYDGNAAWSLMLAGGYLKVLGLMAEGYPAVKIRKYGFAFRGKEVLIG